jgi:hypothetical protein
MLILHRVIRKEIFTIPLKYKTMENNENQINIELSAEVAEGIYSNLAIISHSFPNLFSISFALCRDYPKHR